MIVGIALAITKPGDLDDETASTTKPTSASTSTSSQSTATGGTTATTAASGQTTTTQPSGTTTTAPSGSGLGTGGASVADETTAATGGESMIGVGLLLIALALVLRRASTVRRV